LSNQYGVYTTIAIFKSFHIFHVSEPYGESDQGRKDKVRVALRNLSTKYCKAIVCS